MKTIVIGGAGFLGSHLCDLLFEKGHHNVNTGIVYIFNTYGSRMRAGDDRVVPNFINQALCEGILRYMGMVRGSFFRSCLWMILRSGGGILEWRRMCWGGSRRLGWGKG
jgi:hypothetical protein